MSNEVKILTSDELADIIVSMCSNYYQNHADSVKSGSVLVERVRIKIDQYTSELKEELRQTKQGKAEYKAEIEALESQLEKEKEWQKDREEQLDAYANRIEELVDLQHKQNLQAKEIREEFKLFKEALKKLLPED